MVLILVGGTFMEGETQSHTSLLPRDREEKDRESERPLDGYHLSQREWNTTIDALVYVGILRTTNTHGSIPLSIRRNDIII